MSNEEYNYPVDVEKGKLQVGNEEIFLNMMENFELMSLFQNLLGMKIGLEKMNFQEIEEEAHSLKGSSEYICASELTRILDKLEIAARNEDYMNVEEQYTIFISEILRVMKFIKKYLSFMSSNLD